MKSILYIILGAMLIFAPSIVCSQTKTVQKVATDLFFASGKISEKRPTIQNTSGLSLPAKMDTRTHLISIDKKALDMCENNPNSIATLLAPLFVEEEGENKVIKGAFIGYMAGYTTLGPDADKLWAKLYAAFPKMKTSTELKVREEWMIKAQAELNDYIPIFDMANYFTIIGKYEYANIYYEKIKLRFPSREVYNNAGIINALLALDCYTRDELTYIYPFVLDLSSKAGQKGEMHKKDEFLLAAKKDFKEALRRDPDYAIGHINLSCTQSLLKDFSEAIAHAKKAKTLAESQGSDRMKGSALIALGIAYAESGDKVKSDEAFFLAAKIDDESIKTLVKLNQKQDVPKGKEKMSFEEEEIGGSATADLANEIIHGSGVEEPFLMIPLKDKINLFVIEETGYQLIYQRGSILEAGKIPMASHYFFQKTNPTYVGKSAEGISLDADISEVLDAYGDAAVIRRYGDGRFYYYKSAGIIFKIDEDNSVEGWTLVHEN